jgi:hypothetical protein
MYQLTVTASQHPESTVLSVSLWEHLENGSRRQVRLSNLTIPQVNDGLFDLEPEVFLEECIEWLADIHGTWRHTHQ